MTGARLRAQAPATAAATIDEHLRLIVHQAENLRDVGKALPDQYGEIGATASKLAQHYANDVSRILRYIEAVDGQAIGMPEVAEIIERRLDEIILQTLDLYDAGKALPHPYNAVGEMASKLAHDFIGDAFMVKRYIEAVGDAAQVGA